MTPYNSSDFDPPAPFAYVMLKDRHGSIEWPNVPMQLDSGADVTLVPQAAINKLNLAIDSSTSYELTGFDGTTSVAYAVDLQMLFCRRTFRGKFLLIDQPVGIIDRDLLNMLLLLLDGPNLTWSEHRGS